MIPDVGTDARSRGPGGSRAASLPARGGWSRSDGENLATLAWFRGTLVGYPRSSDRDHRSPAQRDSACVGLDPIQHRPRREWFRNVRFDHDRPDDAFEASVPFGNLKASPAARPVARSTLNSTFSGEILDRDPLYADVAQGPCRTIWPRRAYYNRALASRSATGPASGPIDRSPGTTWRAAMPLLGMTDRAFDALERALRLGYSPPQPSFAVTRT